MLALRSARKLVNTRAFSLVRGTVDSNRQFLATAITVMSGRTGACNFSTIPIIDKQDLEKLIEESKTNNASNAYVLIDVRSEYELLDKPLLPTAHNIPCA